MSMTREEAIAELQECIDAWDKWVPKNGSMADRHREAIKIALSALRPVSREQIERMRGTWIPVMESEITGFNPEFAGRDPIGGYKCSRCKAEAVLDCNDEYVLSNFCRECGAPMTDEAVDMVVERVEALHGDR